MSTIVKVIKIKKSWKGGAPSIGKMICYSDKKDGCRFEYDTSTPRGISIASAIKHYIEKGAIFEVVAKKEGKKETKKEVKEETKKEGKKY